MLFRIEFSARLNGAIGLAYKQPTETIEAETKDAAILKLYDRFENIHVDKIKQLERKSWN